MCNNLLGDRAHWVLKALSHVNASNPCDRNVKKDHNLLFDWNMAQWLETELFHGFDEENERTSMDTKLSLKASWMPRE